MAIKRNVKIRKLPSTTGHDCRSYNCSIKAKLKIVLEKVGVILLDGEEKKRQQMKVSEKKMTQTCISTL